MSALPSRENECVRPCTKPRLLAGNQFVKARACAGSAAPSPTPSSIRAQKSDTMPPARPVATVATIQIDAQIVRVVFAPKRSLSQPPITWQIA